MASIKSIAQAIGVIPTVETAQARLEAAQQQVVDAGAALAAARDALTLADADTSADGPKLILSAESAVVAAEAAVQRAVRQEQIHQRHYRRALEARGAELYIEGRKALVKATAAHLAAAKAAQTAIGDLAAAAKAMDRADVDLYALSQQKIASPHAFPGSTFGPGPMRSRIRIELERNGVFVGPHYDSSYDSLERWAEKVGELLRYIDAPVDEQAGVIA